MNPARVLLLLPLLAMSGCMNLKLPAPTSNMENIMALREAGIGSTNVGKFELAAGKKAAIDKSVSARGSSASAESGSFSTYLRDTLVSDLRSAQTYDPNARASVEGELTDNQLHAAGVSEADAMLAVRFRVRRDGTVIYDKLIDQHATWKSSFVGAVAIPDAFNHFTDQFRLILLKLYKDAEFRNALKLKPP